MAYRYGVRQQMELFPRSIEDYTQKDDPVRAYDAFVEALDFDALKIILDQNKVGNPAYNPKAMVKLIIYGTSYGVRSSRKLERATYHNLSFIWLMGGLTPDHKTIAEFRRNNKSTLRNILKQCARLCLKLKLIEGNILFTDGTKIRGNASIKNSWTEEKCKNFLKQIDERIEKIFTECDVLDEQDQNQESLVRMQEELKDKHTLKTKVQNILKELEQSDKKSINTIDKECTRINSIQGSHAGYNAQTVVDAKHGLIISSDVVNENNDLNQFANQITQANETLGKKCKTACADSGYANTDELKKINDEDIQVVVPSQRQASKKEPKEFSKERFTYNAEKDCYLCPKDHRLIFRYINEKEKQKVYKIANKKACLNCCYFKACTKSKNGRTITRLINEETRLKLEAHYLKSESQVIYKLRKQKVELPFGHIKRNLGVTAFLLRGLNGVKAEMSILSTCFNIRRMITIWGVSKLIEKLEC